MIEILELVTDGGKIAVLGQPVGETWRYVIIVSAPALVELSGGVRETPLATWDEVIEKLDRFGWRNLRMRFLHPDFAKRVEAARRAGTVH